MRRRDFLKGLAAVVGVVGAGVPAVAEEHIGQRLIRTIRYGIADIPGRRLVADCIVLKEVFQEMTDYLGPNKDCFYIDNTCVQPNPVSTLGWYRGNGRVPVTFIIRDDESGMFRTKDAILDLA